MRKFVRVVQLCVLVMVLCCNAAFGQSITTGSLPASTFLQYSYNSLNVPLTATNFPAGSYTFTVQRSDASGSFASPTTVGSNTFVLNGNTTVTNSISVNSSFYSSTGTGYRARVICSSPAVTGTDNGTNLSIVTPSISIYYLSPSNPPQGGSFNVTYTVPADFNSSNTFSAQIFANGSYQTIGTLASDTSGVIQCTMPAGLAPATYQIIVSSSSPSTQSFSSNVFMYLTIATGTITGSPLIQGAAVSVPFTINGTLPSGNVFTAQLSDTYGSFANPASIGTLSATGPGIISAAIPAGQAPGTGYRIRVVASTGTGSYYTITPNTSNIAIVVPSIATGSLPASTFLQYSGNSLAVPFTATNFPAGTYTFTAQRSDASGSFATPTTVGTNTFVLSGSATVANNLTLNSSFYSSTGTGYRVRVVCASMGLAGTDNGTNLSIVTSSINIYFVSPSNPPQGGTINVTYTVPADFNSSNTFTAKLSGNGVNQTIGSLSSDTSGVIQCTMPAGLAPSTYQIIVSSSSPSTQSFSSNVFMYLTIATGTITGSPLIQGAAVNVPFTINGTLPSGNVFTAQLSDVYGSFANPVSIGTLSATGPGIINAAIPAGQAPGTGYRIRVVASSGTGSYYTNTPNTSNIAIAAPIINALDFDGSNDNISLPAANNLPVGNSPYTLEAWVKPTAMGTYGIIGWGGYGTSNAVNALRLSTTGIINYWWGNDLTVTTADLTGAWHHIAATYDGTNRIIYLDGAVAGQDVPTANVHAVPNATNARIGSTNNGEYFPGNIDEVRIWNHALCQAEIQNNMNGMLPVGQSGLLAYYNMNQGAPSGVNTSVTSLTDASGNSNTGTLNGFALTAGSTSNFVASTVATSTAATFHAPVAATTSNTTQTISGSTDLSAYCAAIANVTPSGASPVSGSVAAAVTIDGAVQSYGGHAYVQRHYDITPATNISSATANITLYYTQADFDAYNAANSADPDLPTGPSDNSGISHFALMQYHGTSATGLPGSYTYTGSGAPNVVIIPTNISWNSTAARWEVTFPVTGFSGFFATGYSATPLAIVMKDISAKNLGDQNQIDWSTATENAGDYFNLERSFDAKTFTGIGTVSGKSATGADYRFIDAHPTPGISYYRLLLADAGGNIRYSKVVSARVAEGGFAIEAYPNPVNDVMTIRINGVMSRKANIKLTDMAGRMIRQYALDGAATSIPINGLASGTYLLSYEDGSRNINLRITKE